MPVRVVGPRDPNVPHAINTTSRATGWSRGLSPFFVGPVEICEGVVAHNVENAWQFAKVYPAHVDAQGEPTHEYWDWAMAGWTDSFAHRYPMGRGAVPLFSIWDGRKLSYIEARRQLYLPIYAAAVARTEAYSRLYDLHQAGEEIVLWDFDGYDHLAMGRTLAEVVADPTRKCGHAFVLAMMLDGCIDAIIAGG